MKLQDHPLYDKLDFVEKAVLESYGLDDEEYENISELEDAIV